MKELSEITALFVDHGGLYQPLAECLARTYKRVLYHDPCEEAFPTVNKAVIGETFPSNERLEVVREFWPLKREIDLCVFPDSQGAGLQAELLGQGKPVWGSLGSCDIEHDREKFIGLLKENGFAVPPYEKVVGVSALREHLKDKTDKRIKVSRYRGTMETYHWRDYGQDGAWLDWLSVLLGGVKDLLPFLVFDSVDNTLEIGGDTYCIMGKWPNLMLDGFEWKDKGYYAALKKREDMPEPSKRVLEAFGPILKECGHMNFWSMEIIVSDGEFYFLDPTPRGPIPGSASQIALYTNLPKIIAAGAEGECLDPKPTGEYAAECALSLKPANKPPVWDSAMIPNELKEHVMLSGYCTVKDRQWFPPTDTHEEGIGWLSAVGNTPTETIEKVVELAKLLPDGIHANTDSLVHLLKEIHESEAKGIEFSKDVVPEPETVVSD